MNEFDKKTLQQLRLPTAFSHKGQNGKIMIIGGSSLFHAASIWSLTVASRIVDMVFYASTKENIEIVQSAKKSFMNGIFIPHRKIEDYLAESDAILIGPGMVRTQRPNGSLLAIKQIEDIESLEDEGLQTYYLLNFLLMKYPKKKWIIDAGALQMMDPQILKQVGPSTIITPHHQELFYSLGITIASDVQEAQKQLQKLVEEYHCTILLKGQTDIICNASGCVSITGGNQGMTKGGTGDVLAGLVAALAATNDLFLAACAASYLNKKAGEYLYKKVGYYFNASDLADAIPAVMKQELLA